jgi:hypothetical protein
MIRLTIREWQILRGISFGWSHAILADNIERSRSSVNKHADSLFIKLRIERKDGQQHRPHTSNGLAVRLGYEHGFLCNGDRQTVSPPFEEWVRGAHPAGCYRARLCRCDGAT